MDSSFVRMPLNVLLGGIPEDAKRIEYVTKTITQTNGSKVDALRAIIDKAANSEKTQQTKTQG